MAQMRHSPSTQRAAEALAGAAKVKEQEVMREKQLREKKETREFFGSTFTGETGQGFRSLCLRLQELSLLVFLLFA